MIGQYKIDNLECQRQQIHYLGLLLLVTPRETIDC